MTRVAEMLNMAYHGCKEREKPELFQDVRKWLLEMDDAPTMPDTDILNQEQLKEILAQSEKYKGYADRAATPGDTKVIRWFAKTVSALCRTLRVAWELVYVPKILPSDDEITYRDEAERLLRQNVALREQLAEEIERADGNFDSYERVKASYSETVNKLAQVVKERERLLRGDFTPEEFQDLCHDTDVQAGFDAFANGCEAYQQKMFGRCRKGATT